MSALLKPKRFVANLEDNEHCLQAVYTMVVEIFTNTQVSMKQAESETGYNAGTGTWPFKAMLSFAHKGWSVVVDDLLDAELFAADPLAAILKQTGDSKLATDTINSSSDITKEAERVRECLSSKSVHFTNEQPDIHEITLALSLGGAVCVNVNALALYGKTGYSGHFVLILGVEDDMLYLADPGLPPREKSAVSIEEFRAGWEYPRAEMANLLIVFPTPGKAGEYLKKRVGSTTSK